MNIRSPLVQALVGPFLVGLYDPTIIPIAATLSGAASGILYRGYRSSKKYRRPIAVACALCLYVCLALIAAFAVDRSDRDFQAWFLDNGGVRVGMDSKTARDTINSRAFLFDPPYMIDSMGESFIEDFIVIPKSLAIFNLKRKLDEDEGTRTIRLITDRNNKVVRAVSIGSDPDSRRIRR